MQPITCPACGHEFDTPVSGSNGPECPRCGEPTRRPVPGADAATYLSAALGGAVLGLLTAAILLISRS